MPEINPIDIVVQESFDSGRRLIIIAPSGLYYQVKVDETLVPPGLKLSELTS